MNENPSQNPWLNRRARIEILKDGSKLIYTAQIVEWDACHVSFIDRDNKLFSFNRDLIKEVQLLDGGL